MRAGVPAWRLQSGHCRPAPHRRAGRWGTASIAARHPSAAREHVRHDHDSHWGARPAGGSSGSGGAALCSRPSAHALAAAAGAVPRAEADYSAASARRAGRFSGPPEHGSSPWLTRAARSGRSASTPTAVWIWTSCWTCPPTSWWSCSAPGSAAGAGVGCAQRWRGGVQREGRRAGGAGVGGRWAARLWEGLLLVQQPCRRAWAGKGPQQGPGAGCKAAGRRQATGEALVSTAMEHSVQHGLRQMEEQHSRAHATGWRQNAAGRGVSVLAHGCGRGNVMAETARREGGLWAPRTRTASSCWRMEQR